MRDALGPGPAEAVLDWARTRQIELRVERRMPNGLSGAPAAIVTEKPPRGRARKVFVKVCVPDGPGDPCEPQRHTQALAYSAEFASAHLVEDVHDPLRLGDGSWVVFQRYVGGPTTWPTLASLLDSAVDPRRRPGSQASVAEVVELCEVVVRSLRNDWVPADGPAGDCETVDPVTFLSWNLGGRLAPGGSLRTWAQDKYPELLDPATRWLTHAGTRLPNPFAVILDPTLTKDRTVWAQLGPTHGDLHPDNVMVLLRHGASPGKRQLLASNFRLVDLERFTGRGPLSFDAVHLLVAIVARHLHRMSPDSRSALIPILVDPADDHSGHIAPGWVQEVATAIVDAAAASNDEAYDDEWSMQRKLSLLACGLIFAGRRTTSDAQRGWFLGLAAHAAQAFLEADGDDGWAATPWPAAPPAPLIEVEPPPPVPLAAEPDRAQPPAMDATDPAAAAVAAVAAVPDPCVDGGPEPPGSPVGASPERTSVMPTSARLEPPAVEPGRSPTSPHREAADQLAERVTEQWEAALEGRRLAWPGPVAVGWRRSARPVVGPASDALGTVVAGERAGGPLTSSDVGPIQDDLDQAPVTGEVGRLFADVYRRLRPPGRLVILGDRGAGKTAAVIRLVLDVLRHRAEVTDQDERAAIAVPVILTPHDWDPENQDLTEWLARRLAADYSPSRSRQPSIDDARALVQAKRIVLVLDGLDDMPREARAVAMRALNKATFPVVLLSRPTEMADAAAGVHLHSAFAVELQRVEPHEAADYIVRCGLDPLPGSWQRLVDSLRRDPDGPVAEALDSPLMLGLLRDTYTSRDEIDELLDRSRFPTRREVEDHLLHRVLPVAYERAPGERRPRYRHDQAERWLEGFARQMHQDNTRDLAWWRVAEMVPGWWRRIVYGSTTGVLSGLLFGVLGLLVGNPLRGLIGGFLLGPCAAAFDALVVSRDGQADRRASVWRIAVGYALTAAGSGLLTGILLVGARHGAVVGALGGLAFGAPLGVAGVIRVGRRIVFISRPGAAAGSLLSPATCWAQNRRQALLFGSLLGATVGVALVATCVLVGEPLTRVALPVVVGPLVMTAFTMTLSLRTKTTLAAIQLWCRGRCPVRLIDFLEDARARNVLRSAGSVYQFRHARLQDVLCGLPSDPDATGRGSGVP